MVNGILNPDRAINHMQGRHSSNIRLTTGQGKQNPQTSPKCGTGHRPESNGIKRILSEAQKQKEQVSI